MFIVTVSKICSVYKCNCTGLATMGPRNINLLKLGMNIL